jgi:hypothetical protein
MKADLEEWQVYAYTELGRVLTYVLDSETPDDIAMQLETITRVLRDSFMTSDTLITPSNRPEINALKREIFLPSVVGDVIGIHAISLAIAAKQMAEKTGLSEGIILSTWSNEAQRQQQKMGAERTEELLNKVFQGMTDLNPGDS